MEGDAYREGGPLLPRQLTCVLAIVLVAALACMAWTAYFTDSGTPSWTVPVTAVVFAVVIAFAWAARLDVAVSDGGVEVTYLFKTVSYPRDEILDKRVGEVDEIKNYGNWNLKGVKHKLYSRVGDEDGVAIKLKGKRVAVISSADAEELFARVPLEERGDERRPPARSTG